MHTSTGIYYFLHGFKLILKPGVKRFVVLPLLLNTLIFVGLFLLARHFMAEAMNWFLQLLPTWLQWLTKILWLLFVISFILIMTYIYVALANLISAPFNGLLSEKIFLHLTGKPLENTSFLATLKDTPRMLARQMSMIGYYLLRAAGIGILFFIPIIQILATPLWFLFNSWFMALQYVDYPTDNQRIPLKTVQAQLKSKRLLNLSFGMSILIASMIPILNLIVMPAAVAGATELWLKEYK